MPKDVRCSRWCEYRESEEAKTSTVIQTWGRRWPRDDRKNQDNFGESNGNKNIYDDNEQVRSSASASASAPPPLPPPPSSPTPTPPPPPPTPTPTPRPTILRGTSTTIIPIPYGHRSTTAFTRREVPTTSTCLAHSIPHIAATALTGIIGFGHLRH
ncbi:hypothetical protein HZH66_001753 [Vespula vulgaris]|uniref:Uncharacterized protein n=1 Tax=Vespula vulgaris TaxID=7454 RepID=A0A834KJW6_VESVU|nr:hypothetical protein HZH66_001753 [Vespula vulgaris]